MDYSFALIPFLPMGQEAGNAFTNITTDSLLINFIVAKLDFRLSSEKPPQLQKPT